MMVLGYWQFFCKWHVISQGKAMQNIFAVKTDVYVYFNLSVCEPQGVITVSCWILLEASGFWSDLTPTSWIELNQIEWDWSKVPVPFALLMMLNVARALVEMRMVSWLGVVTCVSAYHLDVLEGAAAAAVQQVIKLNGSPPLFILLLTFNNRITCVRWWQHHDTIVLHSG